MSGVYHKTALQENCANLHSHQSFHPADLLALSIFWTHGRTREHDIKGEEKFILQWKWALLSPVEHSTVVRTSTYSSIITETSSYHPSKGLARLLLRAVCGLASSSHHTKCQEPSIDSQPPPVFIGFQSLVGVHKGNLGWGTQTLVPLWDPPRPHLYSRTYLLMKLSYSWLMYAGDAY